MAAFRFECVGCSGFAMGHETGRVSVIIGPSDHEFSFRLSADEARAMATALTKAADAAQTARAALEQDDAP